MKPEGHQSRFSIKRIEYTLKSKVAAFIGRDTVPGHFLKKGSQDNSSPSSALVWTDTAIKARADIPGDIKFTTQPDAVIFTAPDTGASLTYYQDGSFVYAASVNSPLSSREQKRLEQAGLPWWEKDRETIEYQYIYEAGSVVDNPVYGHSTDKGTPYKFFKLRVPVSETETRDFDVYAYGQAIGIVDRRKIHKDDLVRLRVSVRFHQQRQAENRSVWVHWLNLFDVQKLK